MQITVRNQSDDIENEFLKGMPEYVSWICDYFETPQTITEASVQGVTKVSTVVLSQLYTFSSNGDRYLIFNDDLDLKPEDVKSSLETVVNIKGVMGHLCKAKDTLDSEYGVSPDHDPFHDGGYTYLWYCGKEKDPRNKNET